MTDFIFNKNEYKIYIYKECNNHISNFIIKTKGYDVKGMTNFYGALEYYRNTKKIINKKDIYILDLGANIGVYHSYIYRFGYTSISFEASTRTYYF